MALLWDRGTQPLVRMGLEEPLVGGFNGEIVDRSAAGFQNAQIYHRHRFPFAESVGINPSVTTG
jgi:hypothetical protein